MKVPPCLPEWRQQDLHRLESTPLGARIGAYLYKQGSPYGARQSNGSAVYELSVLEGEPWAADYSSEYVDELHRSLTELKPSSTQPDLLVTVPLAVNHESPRQIDTVCEQIEKAAQPLGSVAVLMWANTKYDGLASDRNIRNLVKRAQLKTADLRSQLNHRPKSNVRYITGFQAGDKDVMRMSDIRYSFMAVALERARRLGYSASLPVMWIDADTTHISKNTFTSVTDALSTHAFAHPRVRFSAEWATDLPPNDVTRTFVLQQIIERRLRAIKGVNYRDADYPEESGLAFTLDTYLKARGVNTSSPMNEAPGLVHSYAANVSTGTKQRVEPYDFFADVADSTLNISGRRILDMVASYGFDGFTMMRQNSGRYVPWCDTSKICWDDFMPTITPAKAINDFRYELDILPQASVHRMQQIAKRLWNSAQLS
jgi:hypothetical protein